MGIKTRTLDLVFPAGQSSITYSPRHSDRIYYKEIRLKEYNISIGGNDSTLPSKVNLTASENIFNQNIANGLSSPSFSIPIVLHNRKEQHAGEFTTFDYHYPYPFTVAMVDNKRSDVASYLPANINFTLVRSNLTNQPVFTESTIVLELIEGENKFIVDQLNPKLNIPHNYHS